MEELVKQLHVLQLIVICLSIMCLLWCVWKCDPGSYGRYWDMQINICSKW